MSGKSTYELQLRAEELRKRLNALDANEQGSYFSSEGNNNAQETSKEQEKLANKSSIISLIKSAVITEEERLRESKILVNFPRQENSRGSFSFELSGKAVTWTDIRDKACIMFGHNPEETLVVELRNGQRVLVPAWVELKPGQRIDAEIVEKPHVAAAVKNSKSLSSRIRGDSSLTSTMRPHNSSLEEPEEGILIASNKNNSPNARKEIILDLFLHVSLFVLLAVGLVDPVNVAGSIRWFEDHLEHVGQNLFLSKRSGLEIALSFSQNVTSMNEVWDWMYGPLTAFLVASSEDSLAYPVRENSTWFGFTPPDICPTSLVDAEPLCLEQPFSNRTKRWMTSSVQTEVLGSVRLRAFRVKPFPCRNPDQTGMCYGDYNAHTRDTAAYGRLVCGFEWRSERELSEARPGAPEVVGTLAAYDPAGYVLDVVSPDQWVPALDYLRQNGWVDAAVRGIIIEFTLRNPNSELFASVRALIERDTTGSTRTRWDIAPMRIPQSDCSHCEVRFITDIIALALVLILMVRVFLGGFFFKPEQRIWRTYDFIFCICFFASFIVDMVLTTEFSAWRQEYTPASTMYRSLDGPHNQVRVANRFRAVIVLMITMKFLLQGTFTMSRITHVVFARLLCIYVLMLILLVPFISSLALLVMVLEQGATIQVISFGNALMDIFLIVTGVTDRLTAATPRIGRPSGWSTVFYLFLIAFTWVLVVPTLIAWAVITYERASKKKEMFELAKDEQQREISRKYSRDTTAIDQALSTALPVRQPASMLSNNSPGKTKQRKRAFEDSEYDPFDEKSAVQITVEDLARMAQENTAKIGSKLAQFRRKSQE